LPAGLFLLALVLRLVGIGWGLKNDLHNQSYHPDEPVIFGYSQQLEPAKLDFTPGFYNYGTLYLTVLKVASDATAAYTGPPDPRNADTVWSYVSRVHVAGRLVNAFAGAGTVLLVFLILRRFVGDVGGAAGGLALAVAPAHVVHSRFQTVDIFATFLLTVSIFYALRLVPPTPSKAEVAEEEPPESPKRTLIKDPVTRDAVLAGVFAGLSAGTKYTGVLGLLVLFIVLLMCHRRRFLKEGLLALVTCVVAFVVATPGAILEPELFRQGVRFEMEHTASGHGIVFAGTSSGYVYHLGNLFNGIGILLVILGLGGLAYAAMRKHPWAIALLAFFLLYYFVIGGATDKYMRYTFPLFPAIAVGVGYATAVGHRRGGTGRLLVALAILGIGGADMRGLIRSVRYTEYMTGIDPRDAAARYLKEQAEERPDLVVGLASDPWFWNPPLFPDSTSTRFVSFPNRMQMMARANRPKVTYYVSPDGSHHPFDARLITETKPDYITFSSLESTPPARLVDRTDVSPEAQAAGKQFKEFSQALNAAYTPQQGFGQGIDSVEDIQYIQPVVEVWKRKD
jgi:hypothetical protein